MDARGDWDEFSMSATSVGAPGAYPTWHWLSRPPFRRTTGQLPVFGVFFSAQAVRHEPTGLACLLRVAITSL
jgi:hypothetical protein